MKSLIILAITLLIGHFNIAQTSIPYIKEVIHVDGNLDEAIWHKLKPFKNFQNFYPINEGAAEYDTEVKVFQNGKFLNIAFIYHDEIATIKVNSLKRDNYFSGFHLSDCVGVIIDPYNNQNRGYFFAVNGENAQLDALIANYDDSNLSWDAIWQSSTSVQGTKKIYELQIPLSVFSYEQEVNHWSFQFYTRDAKTRMYTVWNKFQRGFLQYDTRFLKPIPMDTLNPPKTNRTILIPSIAARYTSDNITDDDHKKIQPSLDLQYKINDGLRLDATLNPDFSQVEVDQQVTNLTRFNIVFPERRNFFIENSDMFTTLGAADDINPFYSRFIGATEDILMGIKLSGNITPTTRVGFLNVQGKIGDEDHAQNYSVASIKRQFGQVFNALGYGVNRQKLEGTSFENSYNRVFGFKGNYLSPNKIWSGFATYGYSFNNHEKDNGQVFSIENNYKTRTISFSTKINNVGKNHLTDIGFVPRIHNYDALKDTFIREGYSQLFQSFVYNYYPQDQENVQTLRLINANVNLYWNENGELYETNLFHNSAVFFANQMSAYINVYYDDIKLKYAFDPLRNGQLVLPDHYQNTAIRLGYNSDYTKSLYGSANVQLGSFYEGRRTRYGATLGYRFLPFLNLEANYEYNTLSFDEQGSQDLHLLGISAELFFNNKLNWTTYIQYNQQIDNINFYSRLQWEYKPLSFIYLVFSDNYSDSFNNKNRGVSLKVNRRINF